MDVIPSDDDFSGYKVIVAPMLYMLRPGTAGKLKAFVENGGQLLATYLTGYVDMDQLCYLGGFPGEGLSELFGVISEEIDTLYPGDRNCVRFTKGALPTAGDGCKEDGCKGENFQGPVYEVRDYAEVLRVQDAEVLACYGEDYYAGTPAVTRKAGGQGNAYYVACRMQAWDMRALFEKILDDTGVVRKELPEGVEYHVRIGEEGRYEFYLNCSGKTAEVKDVDGVDLVSGANVRGGLMLEGFGTAVVLNK